MISLLFLFLELSLSAMGNQINSYGVYSIFAKEIGNPQESIPTIPIGEININEKLFTNTKVGLPIAQNNWCLGLEQNGDVILPCFQFHRGSLENFKTGELLIELAADDQIENVSFNNNSKLKDVKLKFMDNAKVQAPTLKFKSNKNSPVQNQELNTPLKKEKGALKGPLGTELKQNEDADDYEFNEVIIPDSDGKTFIERHWKLIVPPLLILTLMGYFSEPMDAPKAPLDAVKKEE